MVRLYGRDRKELKASYSQGSMFRCIDGVRSASDPMCYWGNWLIKNAIILESGTGGISKTAFNFALVQGLQDEGQFLGVEGYQDIKALYLDFESDDSLIKSRQRLLGRLDTDHPYFHYCNLPDVTFKDLKPFIEDWIPKHYHPDVLWVDPLSLAFPSRNENDNAEATKQMHAIRDFARKMKLTIVLVSHSSKADLWGVGHNRGASARPNLADITWNFHSLGIEYWDSYFFFDIPKNRFIHDGFFECIKKEEGEFLVASLPEGYQSPKAAVGTKAWDMQEKILSTLSTTEPKDRATIIEELGLSVEPNSYENVAFHRALTALIQRGEIERFARGLYIRRIRP